MRLGPESTFKFLMEESSFLEFFNQQWIAFPENKQFCEYELTFILYISHLSLWLCVLKLMLHRFSLYLFSCLSMSCCQDLSHPVCNPFPMLPIFNPFPSPLSPTHSPASQALWCA